MTAVRFWLAATLFHLAVCLASGRAAATWRDPERCRAPTASWLSSLGRTLVPLALLAYAVALLSTVVANLDDLPPLRLGAISGRLMGQALFGEAILLVGILASRHRSAARPARAAVLGAFAAALLAVYIDAYRVEPKLLRVRRHLVNGAGSAPEGVALRILHVTDIQTPTIGEHEERALRAGMAYRPDLIILTGDYVQNESGRPTEEQAMQDLRALMGRIHFDAPLGVFATDGDAGPSCRRVFTGTSVRCLVDESALVTLPGGDTLAITGLSRHHGRERDPAWLERLMQGGPRASHRMFISHAPDFVDALPKPVDLALAGHTHGGQVVIPFFGPLKTACRGSTRAGFRTSTARPSTYRVGWAWSAPSPRLSASSVHPRSACSTYVCRSTVGRRGPVRR